MSDRMHPIPFETLLDWVFGELEAEGSVFGIKEFYRAPDGAGRPYMGRRLETPLGPAAGPHTQLAQNLVTAYLCGGRMFELKTVQVIDGEDLRVSKPCILAEDEGYNCEWSTELTVRQAQDEYIKAWFLLHVLAKELGLGRSDGFVFNMSVGYDLAGIQTLKIDSFLENLKDASGTEAFIHCGEVLKTRLSRFQRFDASDLEAVSPHICNSVTISTMHGCPPSETEKIALYLLEQKGLNLLLKCNPTLVGFDEARRMLDALGYTYLQFERASFDNDLQFADAVPMLRRLQARASALGLYFGVKLTNTFPVKAVRNELPDENIYMSGRALLPLSLRVAEMINQAFDGALPISYCGGADVKNIAALRGAGLFPITVCTDLLKPGGYGRLSAMATLLAVTGDAITKLNILSLEILSRLPRVIPRAPHSPRRPPRPQVPKPRADCRIVCGTCASVCPNRANVIIQVSGNKQMLHLDALCNECGNCASFCADKCTPYLEKLTLFSDAEAMKTSDNAGFAWLPESGRFLLRWDGQCREVTPEDPGVPEAIRDVMITLRDRYPWLLSASAN